MFGVVAPDNDELALPIEVEHVHDVQATRRFLAAGRANPASEQQPEDVQHEKRGEQERHDCSENGEQL
jgi:hypothetical protein